ncbi:hypothetical protein COJ96_04005 [Bacillus sp. AFS073361]|nr:hypothetical protein COJ96_04005 [Bacillus sp. AFS073361]
MNSQSQPDQKVGWLFYLKGCVKAYCIFWHPVDWSGNQQATLTEPSEKVIIAFLLERFSKIKYNNYN